MRRIGDQRRRDKGEKCRGRGEREKEERTKKEEKKGRTGENVEGQERMKGRKKQAQMYKGRNYDKEKHIGW